MPLPNLSIIYIALSLLILSGCISTSVSTSTSRSSSPLTEWINFVAAIDQCNSSELLNKRRALFEQHQQQQSDHSRMYLGYLLSRFNTSEQDLEISRELLADIEINSPYAPLRDMVQRELTLIDKHKTTDNSYVKLKNQLKNTDKMLKQSKQEIHQLNIQILSLKKNTLYLADKEKTINALQTQLEMLKTIDGDLSDSQQTINEISQ